MSTAIFVAVFVTWPAGAAEFPGDLQRLQIDRDRQQMELRLRMQQQQERALRPSRDALTEQRRGALEREQVQRQQQLFDEDARAAIAPQPADDAATAARREIQRQRAEQQGVEQAQRFEMERRAQ